MTTPDTEQAAPPPAAEWVTIPEPPAAYRSEPAREGDDGERGRPIGHWAVAGGSGAVLGGAGLLAAFGPVGLAAGAVTAAGGAVAYGYYRVRNGKQSGVKMSRSRTSRSTSRLGSAGKGLGKGKGPKLLGGKAGKLGAGKGPKLGKGGGPKLGRGGGKLLGGKSGKLLGGKAGKLGGGRAGKLGGGRGASLGGKLGRKTTSRLGSVGKSGGNLLGRGGKSGFGLGKRGGKLLGSRGRAGVGNWSKSTGAGAGVLGSKFGRGAKKASGKLGAAALRTKTGQRAGSGFKAAKAAMKSTMPGQGRWKNMHRATRVAMASSRNPFVRWSASIAAAMTVLTAMAHEKWKARKAEQQTTGDTTTESVEGEPVPKDVIHEAEEPRKVKRAYEDFTAEELLTTREGRLALAEKHLKDMKEAWAKVCADGPVDPEDEKEHKASRQRLEREIAELRRATAVSKRTPSPADYPWSEGELLRHSGDLSPEVVDAIRAGRLPVPSPDLDRSRSIHTRRTDTMQSANFPIHEAAYGMATAAAHYTPQDMWMVDLDLEQIHDIPLKAAEALRIYTQNLQAAYPINPAVVEAMGRAYVALGQVSNSMQEIPKLFKQAHEDDIKRKTQPRLGEDKWNV